VTRHGIKTKGALQAMELSISAASLARAKDIQNASDAEQFFDSAMGVLYAGKLWRIESMSADEFGGMPYLYRLNVSE